MKVLIQLIGIIVALISCSNAAASKVIFCYYGSWASGRPGNGKFTVSDINPNLCTHITYTFVGLTSSGTVKLLDSGALFSSFVNLRSVNPKVKLLISMGGWNEGSITYSTVVNSPTLRKTFVNSVYDFVVKNKFDGFDFDWEYPALRGGIPSDKVAYIQCLQELRAKFGVNLLLTAAVGATNSYISSSYDIKNMNKYLDLINLMSYDYHGAYDGATGQPSPLYASSVDTNNQLNQDAAVRAFKNAGADPSKLVMGCAFYGRSYRLTSSTNNKVGAPTSGPGAAGPYTGEPGTLSYLEICEKLKTNGWTVVWDNVQKNPYAYNGLDWIGYDNVQSIRGKAQYVLNNNLAGIMMWSIESDDKNNICGGGKFPLLTAINDVFKTGAQGGGGGGGSPTTTTTTKSPTTKSSAVTTTTANPNLAIDCNAKTMHRDPVNCGIYYTCVKNGDNFTIYKQNCPSGLYFDLNSKSCSYPNLVTC